MGELDDVHLAQEARAHHPPHNRVRIEPHQRPRDCAALAQVWSTYFCCISNPAFEREVEALAARALLRVGLALAWHEATVGAPAVSLDNLVPRFIAAVPRSPLTENAIR